MLRNLGSACVLAASIFAAAGLSINAAQADETFAPVAVMSLPAGATGCNYPINPSPAPCKPLQSFDISYVDAATQTYLLADRSNAAVDVFSTATNQFVKFLQPNPPFAGVLSVSNTSGPNGVMLITGALKPPGPGCKVGCGPVFGNGKPVSLVWASDGPDPTAVTVSSSGVQTVSTASPSSVKVMDLASGETVKVLNTNGVRRSDEMCFVTLPSGASDPDHPYVLVANDDPLDNFVTIWRWDNFAFVQKIFLNGTDQYAAAYNGTASLKRAANGIEQCKFNPRNGNFYINVPATQSSQIVTLGAVTAGTGYVPGTYTNVPLTGGTGTGATANITVGNGTSIQTLGKITGGTGYTAGTYNNVTLTDSGPGSGTGATANITVTGGVVTGLGTVVPGSGYDNGTYNSVPLTDTTHPAATGATANITVAYGAIAGFGTITGGTSYTTGTYNGVALTDATGTGAGATANIIVSGGAVTSVAIVSKGSGYAVNDILTASASSIGGTGSGFLIPVATTINGGVSSITLVSGGSGYSNSDSLTAQISPGGSGFSVPVTTAAGTVTAVTLVNPGSGYLTGDSLSTSNANIGGTGSGFKVPVSVLGGGVTTVTLGNPGFGYTAGDSLSAAASNIGGTGTGFMVAVATVNTTTTTDGFVLKISLPVQSSPTTAPSTAAQHAKVVAAYEIFPSTGCVGPAGLSIGPSYNGTNSNGLIALGCGATGGYSLIIDDAGLTVINVSLGAGNGVDETWYDPASNHFFFANSTTTPAGGPGSLAIVDANEYPPLSHIQEDGDQTNGTPALDTTVAVATGSHSVAVMPGTCGSSSIPTQLSRVYVPTRSTLSTPNSSTTTFCSTTPPQNSSTFPTTGPAPQWPAATAQAPTATTWDQWGCIAVLQATTATCSSTGHKNPSP
jgi:hypothetical protein